MSSVVVQQTDLEQVVENCVSAPAEEDADTGEVHDDAEHGQHHDGVRAHSHHRQSSLGAHDVYRVVQLNFTPEIEVFYTLLVEHPANDPNVRSFG